MPFTQDGIWVAPTELEIQAFKSSLEKETRTEIQAPPEVMKKLVSSLDEAAKTESNNINFFRTISRIQGPADIVIPIYGGLHVLKDCINSVKARTHWNHRLILVDDASPDPKVRDYLTELALEENIITLFNRKNRGFAATVNRGVETGTNPYIIVLNSDVIVTEGWLTKLLVALEADPRNQIVNPVTNNTAMINVNMYPGHSYLDMDLALNRIRNIRYPETMPTGFCFGVKRSLVDEIGPFDEAYGSYGEETDFWFKAVQATDKDGVVKGYRAVLADNCYMFHERGTSFSQLGEGAHMKQRRAGSERFRRLHPDFGEWSKGYDVDGAIGGLRTKIPQGAFRRKSKGNIMWLVKSAGPCGGMNFIADVVNKLIEEGYNANVGIIVSSVTWNENTKKQMEKQLVTSQLHCTPIIFEKPETFLKEFGKYVWTEGKVIASVTELSHLAKALEEEYTNIEVYNHVQSWDIELAKRVGRDELVPMIKQAYTSVPNIVTSEWVAKELKKIKAKVLFVDTPGVNPDLFHVRERERGDDRFTVGVLLDNMYAYKGYDAGIEFCKKLQLHSSERQGELRILAVGRDAVPEVPGVIGTGPLSQSAMALLMANELDVFVDPAQIHSYGLPALEALFSGCAAVTFDNRGDREYYRYFKDRMYINKNLDKCVRWVLDRGEYLLEYGKPENRKGFNEELHHDLRRDTKVACFIDALYPPKKNSFKTRIEVVTPHLRKHGGPTTNITMANQLQNLGHNVTMSMVYTDWNPEVFNMAEVPLRTAWEKVPSDAKVVIINSDNPFAEKIMELNPGKKYIMYKLSHNERFKETENSNLNLPWDHIVTSTGWLRNMCLEPQEGWDHQAWPEDKVTVVGWYHYGHNTFNYPPQNRTYGDARAGFRIGTLIHSHPLKGTELALAVMQGLKKKWEGNVHIVGFGDGKARLPGYWQYIRSAPRAEISYVMKQLDIWFGASYTEGLGRMTLEAMSSGMAVVTTNTGAEFLKHEYNCLLYPVGEAQQGAELVDRLVQDRDLMQTLVLNGYKTAVEHADPTMFRENLNTVIREVLNGTD